MAEMLKRKDFLENEVVDLREEIALTSPTDTPLTSFQEYFPDSIKQRLYPFTRLIPRR